MNVLIKQATILHAPSSYHQQVMDIHILNGIIQAIAPSLNINGAKVIAGQKLYCTIGLCDIGTHTGEPGYEHRETIWSLCHAALAGGYTHLAVFPNNKPITQSRAHVRYLKEHPDRQGVKISPIGAMSIDSKGDDITEFMDMQAEGVVAFSDGMHAVGNTSLLSRALLYATTLATPIIHHPDDHHLSSGGEMHEGEMSTSLGMKGVPEIAELNMVQRDVLLHGYNGGTIIEHAISAADSVHVLRQSKLETNGISATVAYMNLLFTDTDLFDFDSNLKVQPVLRSMKDKHALIEGIKDDTIDAIITNHTPLDEESKNLEFPYAKSGAIGLETCLAATIDGLSDQLSLETIIGKMTIGPRHLLGIALPEIAVGAAAELCVFDTEHPWVYEPTDVVSKSKNTPYLHAAFKSKVIATIL
ncbi:MAG: amidohydrolase family protein [Saprospiraceae bacterium]|nr:amidohydrolase family protein [Saprospiraceae bacterium]